mmetsp:Transcript_10051/g.29699  ORF Transcript_10051/g.29699 Transcript_10051/m.29699 type:complete len:272 (+) Transcript_10051:500-1315(+)
MAVGVRVDDDGHVGLDGGGDILRQLLDVSALADVAADVLPDGVRVVVVVLVAEDEVRHLGEVLHMHASGLAHVHERVGVHVAAQPVAPAADLDADVALERLRRVEVSHDEVVHLGAVLQAQEREQGLRDPLHDGLGVRNLAAAVELGALAVDVAPLAVGLVLAVLVRHLPVEAHVVVHGSVVLAELGGLREHLRGPVGHAVAHLLLHELLALAACDPPRLVHLLPVQALAGVRRGGGQQEGSGGRGAHHGHEEWSRGVLSLWLWPAAGLDS